MPNSSIENDLIDASGRSRVFLDARQRRKMGLTFRNIRKEVKAMNAEGVLDGDETYTEIAAMAARRLYNANASAFDATADNAGIDWDRIIAIIEKLLPFILMFL